MHGGAHPDDAAQDNRLLVPMRSPVFRRFWFASLFSNLGLLMQGVGAAWAMTELTAQASMVASVQTALMLPIMLIAVPAGAIADMLDKRHAGLIAIAISLLSACLLALAAAAGLLTPPLLLALCLAVGTGNALYGPVWQSSSAEQVPPAHLPSAIALNGIGYNIARSIGPALGGVIVAAAGAKTSFALNASLYLPLLAVLILWKRQIAPPRLPREKLWRAVSSGLRYIVNAPPLRIVLMRCFIVGMAGASLTALMPLMARDLMGGGARTYGVELGAYGVGAVLGALLLPRIRARLSGHLIVTVCALVMAGAIAVAAFVPWPPLVALMLLASGAAWMNMATVFNIVVQLSAPRWVAGRAIAAYQASISGGIAIGSWIWGHVAQDHGVVFALGLSAAMLALTPLLGLLWPIPTPQQDDQGTVEFAQIEKALALTDRSGPIVIEIEYEVDPDEARAFYRTMQALHTARRRIGAYQWTIARDIADPAIWIERYHLPTWIEYLRHRSRHTAAERNAQDAAKQFHRGAAPVRVRRLLERPFGSVRWREETPDPGSHGIVPPLAPPGP